MAADDKDYPASWWAYGHADAAADIVHRAAYTFANRLSTASGLSSQEVQEAVDELEDRLREAAERRELAYQAMVAARRLFAERHDKREELDAVAESQDLFGPRDPAAAKRLNEGGRSWWDKPLHQLFNETLDRAVAEALTQADGD